MALPKLETPTYRMQVPSSGKMVSFRPYLVKEEKILLMALESQDDKQMVQAVKDIIAACTFNEINVRELTMYDLEYVFTQLRAKSVGEISTVLLKCEKCEVENEIKINLERDVKVSESKDVDSKIQLTDQIGVVMRHPDVDTMLQHMTSDGKDVDKIFAIVASCIDYIYQDDQIFDASEQSQQELRDFIESLSSEQFARIKKFIESMPNTVCDSSFDCVNCQHHNKVELRGMVNFFG